jgi:hypothetical protein
LGTNNSGHELVISNEELTKTEPAKMPPDIGLAYVEIKAKQVVVDN